MVARIPKSAWGPRNNELVGVAKTSSIEVIANNSGNWIFHCHLVHLERYVPASKRRRASRRL
ncbi:multicopper oxidase domain-containing protein [Novipirellula maiorica]|uniref:multicopper oxidase domain-containing protein n=1 Tax=Novipirellula maiorica TaxID=1265734 RepID=UPI0036F24EF8